MKPRKPRKPQGNFFLGYHKTQGCQNSKEAKQTKKPKHSIKFPNIRKQLKLVKNTGEAEQAKEAEKAKS